MDIYIFVFCVCWRTYLSCPSPLLPERLLLITPHHHTCQHITLLTMAKGLWKRSCPPVVISDCNQNLSTPWISESKNGLASEDPLSQSTVCNGIQGDYHYGVTLENQAELSLYTTQYSRWDFPEYPFLFKELSKATCWAISRFKRDGFWNVWGQRVK